MADLANTFTNSVLTEARSYVLGGTLTFDEAAIAIANALAIFIAHNPSPAYRAEMAKALGGELGELAATVAIDPVFRAKAESRDPAIFSRSTQ